AQRLPPDGPGERPAQGGAGGPGGGGQLTVAPLRNGGSEIGQDSGANIPEGIGLGAPEGASCLNPRERSADPGGPTRGPDRVTAALPGPWSPGSAASPGALTRRPLRGLNNNSHIPTLMFTTIYTGRAPSGKTLWPSPWDVYSGSNPTGKIGSSCASPGR